MAGPSPPPAASPRASGLLDRYLAFVAALRRAGVGVGVSESRDGVAALAVVDLLDRAAFRAALRATTVKRAAYEPVFDALFELYWPPGVGELLQVTPDPARPDDAAAAAGGVPAPGDGGLGSGGPGGPGSGGPGGGAGGRPPAEEVAALRAELARTLADGDEDVLRRLARRAVARLAPPPAPAYAYKVLGPLAPTTLTAQLLDGMLTAQGTARGGLAEQVARATLTGRIDRFSAHVEAEVRRRVAEQRGVDRMAALSVPRLAETVDFLQASRADLVEMRRLVHPLARRMAHRLAPRRDAAATGRLDFRRTVRASLATGGVPVVTHTTPPRPHKPDLVLLADLSGSVASFAHLTLMLTHALRQQFTGVRAFAFVDHCDEITREVDRAADAPDLLARVAAAADLVRYDGHSDYGTALASFEARYRDALTPRTALLVLGDGRTNYRPPGLATLRRLVAASRQAWWLNPEPVRSWGGGDSVAPAYAEVLPMVQVRNLAQLADFVHRLLPLGVPAAGAAGRPG